GTGTGLKHDQWKFVIELTLDDLIRRLHNQTSDIRGQFAQLAIRQRSRFLEDTQRSNERSLPTKSIDTDRKILDRALGLRTPIAARRNSDFTHGVVFDTHFGHVVHLELRSPLRRAIGTRAATVDFSRLRPELTVETRLTTPQPHPAYGWRTPIHCRTRETSSQSHRHSYASGCHQ